MHVGKQIGVGWGGFVWSTCAVYVVARWRFGSAWYAFGMTPAIAAAAVVVAARLERNPYEMADGQLRRVIADRSAIFGLGPSQIGTAVVWPDGEITVYSLPDLRDGRLKPIGTSGGFLD